MRIHMVVIFLTGARNVEVAVCFLGWRNSRSDILFGSSA